MTAASAVCHAVSAIVGALRDEAGDFRLAFALLAAGALLLLIPVAGMVRRD